MTVTRELELSPVSKIANDFSLLAMNENLSPEHGRSSLTMNQAAVQVLRCGKVNYWTGGRPAFRDGVCGIFGLQICGCAGERNRGAGMRPEGIGCRPRR